MSNITEEKPLARGTVIASRYEIEKYLGESLVGPTYVVRHVENEKWFALRFIRSEYKSKDELANVQEILYKLREIKHPNMIQYGNIGVYGNMIFYTQEYFPSINLRQSIIEYQSQDKNFEIYDSFFIAAKILEALSLVHEAGLLHTNLKPENILLKQEVVAGRVRRKIKVNDLMAAAILGEDRIVGSPYRAPECRPELAMEEEASPQSDIFSVGNILYELLIGKPAQGTYLAPSQFREDLSEEVDSIINYALNIDPKERYKTANDMLVHIQRTIDEPLVEDDKQQGKLPLTLTISAVAVLAILVLTIFIRGFGDNLQTAEDEDLALLAEIQTLQKLPSEGEMQAMSDKEPDMLYIPAGPAAIGIFDREYQFKIATKSFGDTRAHLEQVEAFYIDRFEYPNRIQEDGNPQRPYIGVSYEQAKLACEQQEKRLCTAIEWEKSCRGPENHIYGYGDSYDADLCNEDNYNNDCKSGYGVYGMSAGPREWTKTEPSSSKEKRILKGGDVGGSGEKIYRCSYQTQESMTSSIPDPSRAFRCCLDADKAGTRAVQEEVEEEDTAAEGEPSNDAEPQ
ncbi:MAG: SUMF1/EgtB/PvdO family nonheme iron enzyme [Myxococcota bacterium]|nr:SUMF1/EgtB/PvdO family nonheme iron enzyme [Myxococcota bacterium]